MAKKKAQKPIDDMGKLNSDIASEFDIDVEQPTGKGRKVATAAKTVGSLIYSTAEGMVGGATNELKNRFPNTAGLVDEAFSAAGEIRDLKNEIANEMAPAWNSLKGITLKMMPMTKLLMPKKLYKKIEDKLKASYEPEDGRTEEQKAADARAESINSQVASIFQTQLEAQQNAQATASAEKHVDRVLQRVEFKADQEAFASLDAKLAAMHQFMSGSLTAYMKKSLELKYHHLYVAKDIFSTVRVMTKIVEARLEEIKHNTALPDHAKITMKERVFSHMKEKAAKGVGDFVGGFFDKFKENIKEKVMGTVQNITRNIIPMLSSVADVAEMYGPITKTQVAGKLLGGVGDIAGGHLMGKYLDDKGTLISAVERQAGRAKDITALNSIRKAKDLGESESKILQLISDLIPGFSPQVRVNNDAYDDPTKAVPFDMTTRRAIIEVIPEHLSQIGSILEGVIKTVNPKYDYMSDDNRKIVDAKTGELTTRSAARERFIAEAMGTEQDRAVAMTEMLAETTAIAKHSAKFTPEEVKHYESEEFQNDVSDFLANLCVTEYNFDENEIKNAYNALLADEDYRSNFLENGFKGIKDPFKRATIIRYYYGILFPDGEPNVEAIDHIKMMLLQHHKDFNPQQMFNRVANSLGQRSLMKDYVNSNTGKVKTDKVARMYNKHHRRDSYEYNEAEERLGADYAEERDIAEAARADRASSDSESGAKIRKNVGAFTGMTIAANYAPSSVVNTMGKIGDYVGTGVSKTKGFFKKVGDWFKSDEEKEYERLMEEGREEEAAAIKPTPGLVEKVLGDIKEKGKKLIAPKDLKFKIIEVYFGTYGSYDNSYTGLCVVTSFNADGKSVSPRVVVPTENVGVFPEWDAVVEAFEHNRQIYPYINTIKQVGKQEYFKAQKAAIAADNVDKSSDTHRDLIRTTKTDIVGTTDKKVAPDATAEESSESWITSIEVATTTTIPQLLTDILKALGGKPSKVIPSAKKKLDEETAVKPKRTQTKKTTKITTPKSTGRRGRRATPEVSGDVVNVDDLPSTNPEYKSDTVTTANNTTGEANVNEPIAEGVKPESTATVKSMVPGLGGQSSDKKGSKGFFSELIDGVSRTYNDVKTTVGDRDLFLSKIPEKYRDKVGKLYDSTKAGAGSLNKFFDKVSGEFGEDPRVKKLLDTAKETAATIKDDVKRREFVDNVMNTVTNTYDTLKDKEKRQEALDKAEEKIKEYTKQAASVVGIGEDKETTDGEQKQMTFWEKVKSKAKSLWEKVKQSKIGRWVRSKFFGGDNEEEQDEATLLANQAAKSKDEETKGATTNTPSDNTVATDKPSVFARIKRKVAAYGRLVKGKVSKRFKRKNDASGVKSTKVEQPTDVKSDNPWNKFSKETQEAQQISSDKKSDITTESQTKSTKDKILDFFNDISNKFKGKFKKKEKVSSEDKETASDNQSSESVVDKIKGMFKGDEDLFKDSGAPESGFHADFRIFANKILAAISKMKGGIGRGGGGILESAIRGGGRIIKGVGSIAGGVVRGYGQFLGGLGRGIGSVAKAVVPGAVTGLTNVAGGLAKGIGSGIGGIAKGYGQMASWMMDKTWAVGKKAVELVPKGVRAVGKALNSFLDGMLGKVKYVDIYLKDNVKPGNPLLSAKRQEQGVQFEDGSKVEKSSDITKPVFGMEDGENKCLITEDDIKKGLVDKDNKPITSAGGKIGDFLDKLGWGGKILHLAGRGVKAGLDVWGKMLSAIGIGAKGVAKAGTTLLGRLLGIEGRDFTVHHAGVIDRLDTIISLMGGTPPSKSGSKASGAATEKSDATQSETPSTEGDNPEQKPEEKKSLFEKAKDKLKSLKDKFTDKFKSTSVSDKPVATEPNPWNKFATREGSATDQANDNAAKAAKVKADQEEKKKIADENMKKHKERMEALKEKDGAKGPLGKATSWIGGLFSKFFGGITSKLFGKDGWFSKIGGKLFGKTGFFTKAWRKGKAKAIKFLRNNKLMQKLGGKKLAKWLGGTKGKLAKLFGAAGAVSGSGTKDLFEGAPPPENQTNADIRVLANAIANSPAMSGSAGAEGGSSEGGVSDAVDNVTDLVSNKAKGRGTLARKAKFLWKKLGRSKFGKAISRFGGKATGAIGKGVGKLAAKVGLKTLGTKLAGGAALKGLGAVGGKALGALAGPWGLAAAAALYAGYKGIKGASKEATKKNLGIKEGVQVQDRVASGLSQALTFGLGGKRAAKFTRKVLDYTPGMAIVKTLMGDRDAMTDKEIQKFRARCENKIKKGLPGYDKILARFNRAVRMEDWPTARAISGNETSILKNLASPVINVVKDVGSLLFGSNDDELKPGQIKAFQKKMEERIKKGDKTAEKMLSKFNDAVKEQDWRKAREISKIDKKGLLNRSYSNTALAFMGPVAWIIDAFKDPSNKPLTKGEIKETQEFLAKQNNPKAQKILERFNAAVEGEDWKTARQLSGKKAKTFLGTVKSGIKKGIANTLNVLTLGIFDKGDQDKPLKQKEIDDFRAKMQHRIKKGSKSASNMLEKFDEAVAQQQWKKARMISRIKDKGFWDKGGTGRKIAAFVADPFNLWGLQNDDNAPMKPEEISKFQESMQRKIKLGDKTAQRKLDAFNDAVAEQRWKRARAISKMKQEGNLKKAAKAVGNWVAGLFGSDVKPMSEQEMKEFRDKMNDAIKAGDKSAQKKLDMFEDAVQDENWKKARRISGMKNENIFKKGIKKAWGFMFGSDDDPMKESEIKQFQDRMEEAIASGSDPKARAKLDQFNDAVANQLWKKARRIADMKADGVISGAAKKVWNFLSGKKTYEDAMKVKEQLESKIEDEEDPVTSSQLQKIADRVQALSNQGLYDDAVRIGEEGLSGENLKGAAMTGMGNEDVKDYVKATQRGRDILANIDKSREKLSWITSPIKVARLSRLRGKMESSAASWTNEILDQFEDELLDIDEEAEVTSNNDYKEDPKAEKIIKIRNALLDKVKKEDANRWWIGSPLLKSRLKSYINELESTPPGEMFNGDKWITSIYDRIANEKDIKDNVKKVDHEAVKEQARQEFDAKEKEKEAASKPTNPEDAKAVASFKEKLKDKPNYVPKTDAEWVAAAFVANEKSKGSTIEPESVPTLGADDKKDIINKARESVGAKEGSGESKKSKSVFGWLKDKAKGAWDATKRFAKKAKPYIVGGLVGGVAGVGAVAAYKGLKKFFGKKSSSSLFKKAAGATKSMSSVKNVSGTLVGNTLVPLEGEDVKTYNERLKVMQQRHDTMDKLFKREPKVLNSIYTDAGLEAYKNAKMLGASMRGEQYDEATDPVLQRVEANKALPGSQEMPEEQKPAESKKSSSSLFKKAAGAITGMASKAWGGLKSLGSKIWGGVKSAGGKLWEANKSVAKGLWTAATLPNRLAKKAAGATWDFIKGGGVAGAVYRSIKGADTPSATLGTKSVAEDSVFGRMMADHNRKRAIISGEANEATNQLAGMSGESDATREQTGALVPLLERIATAAEQNVDATTNAGEATREGINNAHNSAIAHSTSYANQAIARTKPRPPEPGLKPSPINVTKHALA